MRGPRTLRGQVLLLVALVASLGVIVLVAVFNLVLSSSLDGGLDRRLRSQAAAAATTTKVHGGRLQVRESANDEAIDRATWIFEGKRGLVRPAATGAVQRAADALAGRAHVFHDLPDSDLRLYAAPLTDGRRQIGTVVAAEGLDAYDRTTDLALAGSVALGGLLLVGLLALTWVATGRAIAPVRAMARSAAEWTAADDLDQRFGPTPRPDELGELARTFDGLLDRVAASLRHEQRLSAELSHELRTPLARITAELELLRRRDRAPQEREEAHAAMARNAAEMDHILETLMAAARADAGLDRGRSDVAASLRRLATTWEPALAKRGAVLVLRSPDGPLEAGVDAEVVERIVTPLLHNAARYAGAEVALTARRDNGAVVVEVSDDGPGIPATAREQVFDPGHRRAGHDGDDGHGGAGLGLALARRLARAAGGDVVASDPPDDTPGARLRVVLPA